MSRPPRRSLITVVTYEEVDGIERLQALSLVVGYAAVTLSFAMFVLPALVGR